MRPLRLLLVLLLVATLVPGLVEVAENAWHQVTEGHSAHATGHTTDQGGDHAPEGDEHGCSGTFHVCSCHQSVYSDLAAHPRLRVRDGWRGDVPPSADEYQEPVPPRLDHPPRA